MANNNPRTLEHACIPPVSLLFLLLSLPFPSTSISPSPSPSPLPSSPLPSSPLPSSSPPSPSLPPLLPINERLEAAYVALQAWKHAITEDPKNVTRDWCGPYVCNYTGVFCARAPDDQHVLTVAGVDLNHANISGTLPDHLGMLPDLALLHLNTNRFHGTIPDAIARMHLLHELDLSNNRLSGPFPTVLLSMPSLKYLDLRFNDFEGELPDGVFNRSFDAIFANNNRFNISLSSASIGNSTASVIVLANTQLSGSLPPSIGDAADTLEQLVLLNGGISSCVPPEIGKLRRLTVLDLSSNELVGPLPRSIGCMERLQQLNVAHNMLSGDVPESICELPRLKNFTFSDNYFCVEPEVCSRIRRHDDRRNCIIDRPDQRPHEECAQFAHRPPVHCRADTSVAPPTSYLPTPPPY